MKDEGLSHAAMGQELGRSTESVRRKLYYLENYVGMEIVREQPARAIEIPVGVIEDRDRRLSIIPHDLTAFLMGDPVR